MVDIDSLIIETGLPGLEQTGGKWNARCIVCGDSRKDSHKKRFWVLPPKGVLGYRAICFNCGYNESFRYFLKTYFPDIHKRYFKSKFKDRNKPMPKPSIESIERMTAMTVDASEVKHARLSELPDDHPANAYFYARRLPTMWRKYLFYMDSFKEWVNTKLPGKFGDDPGPDPRIVIPFYTIDRRMFAAAGRSLDPDAKIRYLTVKFDDDHPKIFGLERVDFSRRVYVFEGQIDSLCIPNALAMAGSISNVRKLLEWAPIETFVLVADNEPRNPDVVKFIGQSIEMGFHVCMLPTDLKKWGKDVNDLVKNGGLTMRQIRDIIDSNTLTGLRAKVRFKIWRKIQNGRR